MSNDFDEVLFPTTVSYGCEGGPQYSTLIVKTVGGGEQRFKQRARALVRWQVQHGVKSRKDHRELLAFFYARDGAARGFMFKDPIDYVAEGQPMIATGVAQEYQLHKSYTSGAQTRLRKVYKPDASKFQLFRNGILQAGGSYTLDATTGKVTTALTGTLTWSGWFYVPARFDMDGFSGSLDDFDMTTWANITVVELVQ